MTEDICSVLIRFEAGAEEDLARGLGADGSSEREIRVGGIDLATKRATVLSHVWMAFAPEKRSAMQLRV